MAKNKGGFAQHEPPSNQGITNDWITPKYIVDAFGVGWFDLDPCASVTQPWSCARKAFTIEQNGLMYKWWGNVWLNPPYGPRISTWIRRLVDHGEGVAFIFARTETEYWQKYIFPTADAFLFVDGRVHFFHPDGTSPNGDSGAPSCLIAWGKNNSNKLMEICNSGSVKGAFFGRAFSTPSNNASTRTAGMFPLNDLILTPEALSASEGDR